MMLDAILSLCFIPCIGLTPGEKQSLNLHPHSIGHGSHQWRVNSWAADALESHMKEISLTNSLIKIKISDEDFDKVAKFNWYMGCNGYAYRKVYIRGSGGHGYDNVLLHRFVTDAKEGQKVDHKDRNKTNCIRENLRFANDTQNARNKSKRANTSSQFKGVYFSKANKKWMAYIVVNRKQIYLGYFTLEVEAAKRYNAESELLFGEFSSPNPV